jgi:hypothetical protein
MNQQIFAGILRRQIDRCLPANAAEVTRAGSGYSIMLRSLTEVRPRGSAILRCEFGTSGGSQKQADSCNVPSTDSHRKHLATIVA